MLCASALGFVFSAYQTIRYKCILYFIIWAPELKVPQEILKFSKFMNPITNCVKANTRQIPNFAGYDTYLKNMATSLYCISIGFTNRRVKNLSSIEIAFGRQNIFTRPPSKQFYFIGYIESPNCLPEKLVKLSVRCLASYSTIS